MLNQNTLREATRLTQAGQLTEATALLQRMFRGERAPAAASAAPGRIRLPGRTLPTIDLKANDVGKADRAAPAETPTATPRRRRPLFDRAKDGTWLGLRGVKHAPASMTDIVPEGAKFIEGTYSNPAGSRTYKLFVPTGSSGAAASADRYAPRLHPVAGRFRRRHQDELHRRGTELPSGLSSATQRRQPVEMLELVPQRRPAARRGRTLADRRHHPPSHAGLFSRSQARLCRRPFGRRRRCGNHGCHLQRSVRRGRNPFRPRLRSRHRHALGVCRHAPRGGAGRQAVPGGPTVPSIIFHGDRDTTVHPDNGAQVLEQAIGATRTQKKVHRGQIPGGHAYTRTTHADGEREILEHWNIHGAGHAWSGGSPAGSYTDPQGPDATKEMLRFFLDNPRPPQPH